MAAKFSSGKFSIAVCDRCGFRFKLKQLKRLIVKTKDINILVCPECWEADQPQLQLGMYPVSDPQAVENPRPDHAAADGSRIIQWGWNPVGFTSPFGLDHSDLAGVGRVGTVTVSTT